MEVGWGCWKQRGEYGLRCTDVDGACLQWCLEAGWIGVSMEGQVGRMGG